LGMVFRKSSNAEFIMRKFVPDLENDNLQGFINDTQQIQNFLTRCVLWEVLKMTTKITLKNS
jgi:hypothetical protein